LECAAAPKVARAGSSRPGYASDKIFPLKYDAQKTKNYQLRRVPEDKVIPT